MSNQSKRATKLRIDELTLGELAGLKPFSLNLPCWKSAQDSWSNWVMISFRGFRISCNISPILSDPAVVNDLFVRFNETSGQSRPGFANIRIGKFWMCLDEGVLLNYIAFSIREFHTIMGRKLWSLYYCHNGLSSENN